MTLCGGQRDAPAGVMVGVYQTRRGAVHSSGWLYDPGPRDLHECEHDTDTICTEPPCSKVNRFEQEVERVFDGRCPRRQPKTFASDFGCRGPSYLLRRDKAVEKASAILGDVWRIAAELRTADCLMHRTEGFGRRARVKVQVAEQAPERRIAGERLIPGCGVVIEFEDHHRRGRHCLGSYNGRRCSVNSPKNGRHCPENADQFGSPVFVNSGCGYRRMRTLWPATRRAGRAEE